jgi:hypothetical protein
MVIIGTLRYTVIREYFSLLKIFVLREVGGGGGEGASGLPGPLVPTPLWCNACKGYVLYRALVCGIKFKKLCLTYTIITITYSSGSTGWDKLIQVEQVFGS